MQKTHQQIQIQPQVKIQAQVTKETAGKETEARPGPAKPPKGIKA